jgi:nicotinate phosphoribosyltransferase
MLFTDQYQLTMAQVYYRNGLHDRQAHFEYFFRDYPSYNGHQAGYCISAGLEWLLDWMTEVSFKSEELQKLRNHRGTGGEPLFAEDFLEWLGREGDFSGLSLRAIPEGRVVHPNTPIVAAQGPLAMAQILETSLLNHLNYQSLVATKAARIKHAAGGSSVFEFGLRRAQGPGAVAGTRAALIGGADFSSNVGTSHLLRFPPKGTHAHSMVQVFLSMGFSELDAFRSFAEIYPDDCILLVDTINTLESGVPNAIKVFDELRHKGHQPLGIRLDSGDLAYLSIQCAKMLNDAGFPEARIVLSNDLDELVIWQIITQIGQEAARYGVDPDALVNRLVYGVGTRLITSWGEPALGGVYKLVAFQEKEGWRPILKVSDSPDKIPIPGVKHLWRIYDSRGMASVDLLCDSGEDPSRTDRLHVFHPSDPTRSRVLLSQEISKAEPLLEDVLVDGMPTISAPSIEEIRERRRADVARLDPGVRRLVNPHIYHVSISEALSKLKQSLIERAAGGSPVAG